VKGHLCVVHPGQSNKLTSLGDCFNFASVFGLEEMGL